jgi:hypothetical protein
MAKQKRMIRQRVKRRREKKIAEETIRSEN